MPQAQEQDLKRLEAQRARQQREAARGCLITLVLEGAGLLAAMLWVIALLVEMPRLQRAAIAAFLAFTIASVLAGVILVIQGNLPAQRRLRREHELAGRSTKQETGNPDPDKNVE